MSKRRNNESGANRIKELQKDLRRLGYLEGGIDGVFGRRTERAVMALRFDLLDNSGKGIDGAAPVAVTAYNRSRVTEVTGEADEGLLACIADMLADKKFCKIPESDNPAAENARIDKVVNSVSRGLVPAPFLRAILKRESGLRHFCEPTARDEDSFVVVGLDRTAADSHVIASRGYGAGQYTLFHHPPSPAELRNFIENLDGNVAAAARLFRVKFDCFVNGRTSGTLSEDRLAEAGRKPLRPCKYGERDPRFLTDCRRCLEEAGTADIRAGVTPWYTGSPNRYMPTARNPESGYQAVPVRKNIPCDWPYAARRYNGGGPDSYHYQAKILLGVLRG